jgi:hypothetical protein
VLAGSGVVKAIVALEIFDHGLHGEWIERSTHASAGVTRGDFAMAQVAELGVCIFRRGGMRRVWQPRGETCREHAERPGHAKLD